MTAAVGGRRFHDRADAGRLLGAAVAAAVPTAAPGRPGSERTVVLGLPRGGVVVAAEVARALGQRVDVLAVRKVPSPRQPELAVGAVTADGPPLVNEQVVRAEEIAPAELDRLVGAALAQVREDDGRYRAGRPPVDAADAVVVLVDDGAATGATIRAGVAALRAAGARRVVVALPVAPRDTLAVLEREADLVVCLRTPLLFRAVGWAYDDFGQTPTEEVERLLAGG